MDGGDVLDFFEGGGEATDAADVVFHEDHGGLRVLVDDVLDCHVRGDLVFGGSRFHSIQGKQHPVIRFTIRNNREVRRNRTVGSGEKHAFNMGGRGVPSGCRLLYFGIVCGYIRRGLGSVKLFNPASGFTGGKEGRTQMSICPLPDGIGRCRGAAAAWWVG